jgi:hypothetical protein
VQAADLQGRPTREILALVDAEMRGADGISAGSVTLEPHAAR